MQVDIIVRIVCSSQEAFVSFYKECNLCGE